MSALRQSSKRSAENGSGEEGAAEAMANHAAKRPRRSDREPSPLSAPPPPPPEDDGSDQLPPPPENEPVSPPPLPPQPPVDVDELVPPPPPNDEASSERRRAIAEEQEQDDEAIGGADYWASLVSKESAASKADKQGEAAKELYLDTINRSVLDFDFEKLCSVSLSNVNVYACLVCGKYFQGRGPNSYAYFHAIDESHRVFMNLESGQVYVLPDNYKVNDASLNDIKYLLLPTYSDDQIKRLDAPDVRSSFDLRGNAYLAGFVGLNNLGGNDYMNVVIQALAHVRPLRNFMLRGGPPVKKGSAEDGKTISESDILKNSSELVRRFASLVRKIWNARNTKAQVSPHEFLQEVVNASKGKFSITKQGDPIEFLGWLLNRLHVDLGGGGKKNKRSIISDCFQGQVRIESQKVFVRSGIELDDDKADDDAGRKEGGQEDAMGNAIFNIDREVKVDRSSFFFLTVDLPPVPVFQDVIERNIIPQVSIADVLAKYDGVTFQEARGLIRRFKTLKLPPFLIIHYKRFTKNSFVEERNRTIVNYDVTSLNMNNIVEDPTLAPISKMYDLVANVTLEATAGTVRGNCAWRTQVRSFVDGRPIGTLEERRQRMRRQRIEAQRQAMESAGRAFDEHVEMERIIAEEGGDGEGAAQTARMEEEKWFSIQDLLVEPTDSQLLFLGESYVQIWSRRA